MDSKISNREPIYITRSGSHVERFKFRGQSYIYKPCLAASVIRERWVQQYLMPSIAGLRAPRLLASGGTDEPKLGWIVYEDLGTLVHCNKSSDIIRAAGLIHTWHRIPVNKVPGELKGHSPDYSQVLKITMQQKSVVNEVLATSGVSLVHISNWWAQLPYWEQLGHSYQVISHGDYYPLNIAFQDAESIVLDWEYMHVNSVYWDLYSLMDITSHRYSRIPISQSERIAALHQYWMSMEGFISMTNIDVFIRGYYVFASIYSAWILTLIEADLHQSMVAEGALRRQQQETVLVFKQILYDLNVQEE